MGTQLGISELPCFCTQQKITAEDETSRLSFVATLTIGLQTRFQPWLHEFRSTLGSAGTQGFEDAPTNCPVTAESLRMIRSECCQLNPWLRHNIAFVPGLQMNFSPVPYPGCEATTIARRYWNSVHFEFELYAFILEDRYSLRKYASADWTTLFERCRRRIPILIQNIKQIMADVLATGMTEMEHNPKYEHLFDHTGWGDINLTYISEWWTNFLLELCDTSSEDLILNFRHLFERIEEEKHAGAWVTVIEVFIRIIEIITLDKTNLVIRSTRQSSLENMIPYFQQHYFYSIRTSLFDAKPALAWFTTNLTREDCQLYMTSQSGTARKSPHAHICQFLSKVIDSLISSTQQSSISACFPSTFHLDLGRLDGISATIRQLIFREISIERLGILLWKTGCGPYFNEPLIMHFSTRVDQILGDSNPDELVENVVCEIAHLVVQLSSQKIPRAATTKTHDQSSTQSFLSIADDAKTHLQTDLQTSSHIFQRHLHTIKRGLLDSLTSEFPKYLFECPSIMSSSLICKAFLEKKGPFDYAYHFEPIKFPYQPRVPGRFDLRHITSHLTMILVLHWRIWGPLVYAKGESGVDDWINDLGWDSDSSIADFAKNFDTIPALRKSYYPTMEERAEFEVEMKEAQDIEDSLRVACEDEAGLVSGSQ